MFTKIRVKLNERVVVFRHGRPIRALQPGSYLFRKAGLEVFRYDANNILMTAPAAVRVAMPADWYDEVRIGPRQRGVLWRDDRPVMYLRPGVHRYWTVHKTLSLTVMSIDEPVPEISDELANIIPAGELADVTVRHHERGLLYVQGKFEQLLAPGRYRFWSHSESRIGVQTLDMRLQQITITGQELMTRDKVTLRLTLTIEYAPSDPPIAVHSVANVTDALYLSAQLAARDYIAGVTLDELLEGRDAMNVYMREKVVAEAERFGVRVERVGVKDVVLPGDMKLLLNRVIAAEKEAAANVILRREEAAATRSMANTAKVMAENPVLLRLKELEAVKDIAGNIDEVRLVVGQNGLKTMLGAQLLGSGDDETDN